MMNLMDSFAGDLPPVEMKQDEDAEPDDDTFYPHWKPVIDLNLIHETTAYTKTGDIPRELYSYLQVDFDTYTYQPIMYMSDFWVLKKHMIQLNETITSVNLTLNLQTYPQWYMLTQISL